MREIVQVREIMEKGSGNYRKGKGYGKIIMGMEAKGEINKREKGKVGRG